jgi:hypothetical protein
LYSNQKTGKILSLAEEVADKLRTIEEKVKNDIGERRKEFLDKK